LTLPALPSSCWVRRGSAVDALSAGASSGQLLQRDPPTGEPRHGPTLQETTRRFMDLRRTKWKLAPRLPTWRRNEVAGGTQREFPCTSTRGLVDRRDSNRRCAPKSLPARAADRRNETRLTRLRLAFRARAGQLPWAKKRRRYPRSTRHFPEIWHSRRRKAHRSPFLEWSNYQGDTRHGGPNASTDQS
jgi:hypothetical protein